VRLIEDQVTFEKLYSELNLFSDDENYISSKRYRNKERSLKVELIKVKKVHRKFQSMK